MHCLILCECGDATAERWNWVYANVTVGSTSAGWIEASIDIVINSSSKEDAVFRTLESLEDEDTWASTETGLSGNSKVFYIRNNPVGG